MKKTVFSLLIASAVAVSSAAMNSTIDWSGVDGALSQPIPPNAKMGGKYITPSSLSAYLGDVLPKISKALNAIEKAHSDLDNVHGPNYDNLLRFKVDYHAKHFDPIEGPEPHGLRYAKNGREGNLTVLKIADYNDEMSTVNDHLADMTDRCFVKNEYQRLLTSLWTLMANFVHPALVQTRIALAQESQFSQIVGWLESYVSNSFLTEYAKVKGLVVPGQDSDFESDYAPRHETWYNTNVNCVVDCYCIKNQTGGGGSGPEYDFGGFYGYY